MGKRKPNPLTSTKTLAPGQWRKPGATTRTNLGTLHGPSTLFMAAEVGTATGEDGEVFELLTQGWGPGAPLIRCKRTGLQYSMTWDEIVRLAIEAGIAREHPDMAGK